MQKHGGRLQFQSTLSQGERLCRRQTRQECKGISIHALARRATVILRSGLSANSSFQSTLSQGERLRESKPMSAIADISIHALARRATR